MLGQRDSPNEFSRDQAREAASAVGTALYLSTDRPDTMYASKTAMQHVPKPNVLMNARLQRLVRYYEVHPILVWRYPLQGVPDGIGVDGDGDWAPSNEPKRRSASGGAVIYGIHCWGTYFATQATAGFSSGEPEFYAAGSATARGLQAKCFYHRNATPLCSENTQ